MKHRFFSRIVMFVSMFTASQQVATSNVPITASETIASSWSGGYVVNITVKNTSKATISSWQTSFTLGTGQTIVNSWSGIFTTNLQNIVVANESYNSSIAPGQSIIFGFQVNNPQNTTTKLASLTAIGNPALPVPVAPALNAITVASGSANYTVSWNAVANATGYTLQQSSSSSFTTPVVVAQGTATSQAITNQPNGTYYYRVSAIDATGSSAWSNTQKVVINVAPISLTAPVLQAINNTAGSSPFQLSWSAVPKALGYTVQQSATANFAKNTVAFSGTATSASIQVSAVGTYYYRVIAVAGNSTSSPSNIQSTVITKVPVYTGPIIDSYWESWNVTRDGYSNLVNMHVDVIDIAFGTFTALGNHTFQVTGVESDLADVQQMIALAHSLNKKVKISIGGIGYPIISMLLTDADAMGMAQAVAEYVTTMSLDGVDYDIEDFTPAPLEIALIKYSRQFMPNAIITYTPESPASVAQPWADTIQGAYQYLDYIMIQAYNNYPTYSYQTDVAGLMAMGVPASKIVIGMMPGADDEGVQTTVAQITTASQYVAQHGLRGVMFWDLNRDYTNETGLGQSAATNAAWSVFHP